MVPPVLLGNNRDLAVGTIPLIIYNNQFPFEFRERL